MFKILLIIAFLQLTIESSYAAGSSLLGKWFGEGGEIIFNEDGSCVEKYYFSENNPDLACRYELNNEKLLVVRGNSQNPKEMEIHFKYIVREDRIYSGENEILKKEKN